MTQIRHQCCGGQAENKNRKQKHELYLLNNRNILHNRNPFGGPNCLNTDLNNDGPLQIEVIYLRELTTKFRLLLHFHHLTFKPHKLESS